MSDQLEFVLARKGKRGPLPTDKGMLVGVRLQPALLVWLDAEREKVKPQPSRPEFIRKLIERAKG